MKTSDSAGQGMFARLPVARQMFVAFATVILLTSVVGGVSLYSLHTVHKQADALAEKWLQGVGHLARARSAMIEARDFEVKHSRTADRSYHSEYEAKIADAVSAAAGQMQGYRALVQGEAERKLLADHDRQWAEYLVAQKRVLQLGRDRKQADAADISDGAATMAVDAAVAALDALTTFGFEGGKTAAAQSRVTYTLAQRITLTLLGVALLLGTAFAWLITRGLMAQLGGEPRVAARLARAVAEGDLTTSIPLRPGDGRSLMAQLRGMQESLARAVASVRESSDGVALASAQIAQGNRDLSGRTEQQAASLQQTAATMDELGATVRDNAESARQANQLALGATTIARKGGEVVDQVVQTMRGIDESSRQIADIIGVIDGIAFQTNILALNAAVEAARAGEQGRGFAVVAAEVRSLAQRSADAARQIKSLINASVTRVGQGTALVNQAGQTMTEIVGAIQRVNDIVGEITSASVEQSASVAQVAQTVSQLDAATQQNSALVEQSAAAADSLHQQSEQLVQAVKVFTLAGR
jgi:methyl-accepting chemotaxis protein